MEKTEWYRVKKIRDEIFSGKAEKLSTNIFKISSGEIYKIMPRFGIRYENSPIIRLDPKEVERHVKEDEKIKELAKIMASK